MLFPLCYFLLYYFTFLLHDAFFIFYLVLEPRFINLICFLFFMFSSALHHIVVYGTVPYFMVIFIFVL